MNQTYPINPLKREDKIKFGEIALDLAKVLGASYADFRIVENFSQDISVKNGIVESLDESKSSGFAVRVIKRGAFGFAASSKIEEDEIKKTVALAVSIAEASSQLKKRDVTLAPTEIVEDTYETPLLVDPFQIPLDQKIDTLMRWDALLRRNSRISIASSHMHFEREFRFFASSEGTRIHQVITKSGGGVEVTAFGEGRKRGFRSFPSSQGGQYETRGYELIESLGVEEEAERIVDEAIALLDAEPCPEGEFDIILDGPMVSLQIHESIAHALELDRVMGYEASFSGTSYATLSKLGKLKIGSDIVNIVADGTYPGGLATCGYDDEGVKTHKVYLIKKGVLVGYLSSRETAHLIGRRSSGSMFAQGWANIPLIRITNVNLLPGEKTLEEMISEIDYGFLLSGNTSWSIDERREFFQMGGEIAWEIKGGKLGRIFSSPVYSGDTISFWNSCDAIANSKYWRIWGTPNCGKGEPGQVIGTAQGASPARFRRVKMGR
jgi:TldD protein